ncbi:MAG TPA: DUF2959 domain-containing protein [Candidatus Polarisedimenticolaceae bacterium]
MLRFWAILGVAALVLATGCEKARDSYYKALEKVGVEKREVLVGRVEKARDAQQEAQQQFRDALQEFQSIVGYRGGELEAKYEKLRGEYEDSKKRADDVNDKIRAVRNVATSLFKEWETELGQFTDANLRAESQRELRETQRRYGQVVAVMEKAATRMDPVLRKLNDQVLFLKHNLNARALGSLQGTARSLQGDVDGLVRDMEASIAEASKFIEEMAKQPS